MVGRIITPTEETTQIRGVKDSRKREVVSYVVKRIIS